MSTSNLEDVISKSSKIDMRRREAQILELIGQGASRDAICDLISKEYKISPRTVLNHYYEIVKTLGNTSSELKEEVRAQLITKNEYLYKKALADRKLGVAAQVVMNTAKLAGLEKTDEVQEQKPTFVEVGVRPTLVKAAGDENDD